MKYIKFLYVLLKEDKQRSIDKIISRDNRENKQNVRTLLFLSPLNYYIFNNISHT